MGLATRIKKEEQEDGSILLGQSDETAPISAVVKTEDSNGETLQKIKVTQEEDTVASRPCTPPAAAESAKSNHVKKEEDANRHSLLIKSEEGEGPVISEPETEGTRDTSAQSDVGIASRRDSTNSVRDEAIVIRREENENDMIAFMAQRENPVFKNVKKKDELVALPIDTVYNIITQTGLTDVTIPRIDPIVRDTFVSRYLISDLLGGSPQDTFPTPRPDKIAEHGIKCYMCLVYSFNPFAPQLPGKSGLFFGLTQRSFRKSDQGRDEVVYPYFIRVDNNKWHYLGHYVLRGGRPLTVEEWRQQSPLCKKTWVKDVMNCKGFMKYRAYIRLRRNLEDKDEIRPEAVEELLAKMVKNKSLDDLSLEEIERAFDGGHVAIDVKGMQCIHYDVDFQNKLYEKSQTWSSSNKNKKTSSREKRRRPQTKSKIESESSDSDEVQIISYPVKKCRRTVTPRKKRGVRRRRSEDTSSSEEDELEGEGSDYAIDIDDLENIRERGYVTRGTRSRPAKRVKTAVL